MKNKHLLVLVSVLLSVVFILPTFGCAQTTPTSSPKPTQASTQTPAASPAPVPAPKPSPSPTAAPTSTPAPSPAAAPVFTLKWTEVTAPTGVRAENVTWIKDEIEKRSGGRIKINMFWSGSLLTGKETVKGVKTGVADMGLATPFYSPAELPISHFMLVQFMGVSPQEQLEQRDWLEQNLPAIREEPGKQNLKKFFSLTFTPYQLFSKKPFRKLEDFKGARIRGSSPYADKFFAPVGAVNVVLDTPESYTALDKGTVDAVELATDPAFRYKLFEVAKYMSVVNRSPAGGGVYVVNLDTWNKFPADIQKIFMDVGKEAQVKLANALVADEQGQIDGFKKNGVEVSVFPAAELARWAAMPEIKQVVDNWIKEREAAGIPGVRDAMTRFMDKFVYSRK